MIIDTAKLKISTKTMVSAVLAFGGAMQIPQVSAAVLKLTSAHPHVATVVGVLTGIYALLHNPQVEEALGIKQTVAVTTENVTLAKE